VRGCGPSIDLNPSPNRMYCTVHVALSQKERAQLRPPAFSDAVENNQLAAGGCRTLF
jgi:hypothetical protein